MNTLNELAKSRLLIVDDDLLVGKLLWRWLTDEGHTCFLATNADEAITQLRKQDFDLVTLDVRMPGVSGLKLLKLIKLEFPEIAVLMLTGDGDTSVAVESLTSGAYGYLQKPAERAELVFQVQNALDHRLMSIENRNHTQRLAQKVREQTAAILAAHEETVDRLIRASLYRDDETGEHIKRTGKYSEMLALKAGWSHEAAELIRLAAPLHDVGKIGIPDAILRKPGKLTAEEMSVMQTHAKIGAKMLAGSTLPMMQMAEEIALCHHEKWNGTGYPNGLSRYEIPESARILAIVDVYDALSHDRVYRPAMSEEDVLAILKEGRGQHFDPVLLDAFLEILPLIRAVMDSTIHEEPDVPKLIEHPVCVS